MSCPAADAMSEPADRIAGSMRGASDSGVKDESGDGKVKELAVVTSSICSIEDCMMFASAFNSVMVSCGTLPKRVKHLTSTVNACHTLQDAGRWVSATEKTKEEDSRKGGTSLNNERKCQVEYLSFSSEPNSVGFEWITM